ncbi:CDP-alcohol phosphatidyltransferase [Cavenderia fasciculata]|uniref:CDP-alcohol phosphatidyltransferase n=1 Tax=Cavenderia fasciculata TaxID=261658 RepID=F4PGF6_CACFS|nr:CDP-alcohol phosphatidyltransferase [Cavenderia fasciculata]EGG24790.1 CDP-alcohol phosphatidyltransferase [Cavenderia fasciculata]|eukprot:XP_004362641.1 CDP-alcohol phosphatidyltransferase [Cavenderia fasciculata]
MIIKMPYITTGGAKNLPLYKGGTTIDNSIMYSYVISPACNVIVEIFPKSFQYITATGFVCNFVALYLVSTLIGSVVDSKDGPLDDSNYRWVHFAAAFLIWFYMMMDNIDGKQARRTKTSSPLGELFDHGCDSFTVGLATSVVGLSVGLTLWEIFFVFILSTIPFYLAHWEEYFTHHLILGMLNGPTEAECAIILFCCLTGIYGQQLWYTQIDILGHGIRLKEIMFIIMSVTSISTSLQSIYSGCRKAVAMKIPLLRAFSQLLPFTLFLVLEFIWVYISPQLYLEYPIVFILASTFIFSYLNCRCIVQRICSEDFRMFYKPLIFLITAVFNSVLIKYAGIVIVSEEYALFGLFGISLVFMVHFTYTIIQEMCSILKIRAFTVPKEKQV